MTTLKLFDREFHLPRAKWLRIALGVALVVAGIFGMLPVLGFWMLPLGIVVLSVDIPIVRRLRRRIAVKWERRKQSKKT